MRLRYAETHRLLMCSILALFLAQSLVNVLPCGAAEDADRFADWVAALRQEAIAASISPALFDEVFAGLRPLAEVITLDRHQPESEQTLAQYLESVITAERINRGRRLLAGNHELLEKIHQQYGVEPRFLVALWGLETDYGRITGEFPVIGALATLAYDGRRRNFFRPELLAALQILNRSLLDRTQMKGSWAGAMGNLQFLPSVFLRYAVDYNGNGRIDIWQERGDIFASGANYLLQSGWQRDQGWGYEIKLPSGLDPGQANSSAAGALAAWRSLGIVLAGGRPLPEVTGTFSVIQPDGPEGRVFLVNENYQVLLKWNRSHHFGISVCLLADQLRVE
jgi:membrane-bound lytic murein transglycosylase B